MREIGAAAERRGGRLVGFALSLAAAAAGMLLFWPDAAERLTGIPPTPRVSAPDELPPASRDDPMPFLIERDLVELRVVEETTLAEFLHRNRLNKPSQRKQIARQLGSDRPDARIAAGTMFRLRLTPAASDVPGTSPMGGRG
jgi:hypothetical protein